MISSRMIGRIAVPRIRWLGSLVLIGVVFALTSDAADAQYIFWSDFQTKSIFRADLDGQNRMTIFQNSPEDRSPDGLAFDRPSGHLYWINDGAILRSTADGNVVNAGSIDLSRNDNRYPDAIALDLAGRLTGGDPKIYFNAGAEQIYQVNPDGSDLSLLLEFNDDPTVESLAIDFDQGRFYWSSTAS